MNTSAESHGNFGPRLTLTKWEYFHSTKRLDSTWIQIMIKEGNFWSLKIYRSGKFVNL